MNNLPHQSEDALDRLVGLYLDRETQRADVTGLLARILPPGPQPSPAGAAAGGAVASVPTRRRPRSLAWSAATALAVIAAFLGGRYLGPMAASAGVLLRDARSIHSGGVDRCYRLQYAPDPRSWDGKNQLEGPSESVLWTRGDRFWADCTIGEIKLAIGRDENGVLWVSPSRSKGIEFSNPASQLPEEVALICAINSMTIPTLVEDVLADFELRAERRSAGPDGATTVVWAKLKADRSHPLLSAAMLEIDARSNVVVRLVLWTVRDGRPKGTVTYTLLESAPQSDDQYRLRSHLDPDALIETHTLPTPAA
jgi:hypothetical protein